MRHPRRLRAMKDFRLGVLLVHGIGTQPPRDTLVRWGDVLLKLIDRATMKPDRIIVGRASPGDRSGEKPAEVEVDFRIGDQKERWLVAEGWWADCFPAPTYSELVSWSVRAVPWSIALHVAQRYWQAAEQASRGAKLKAGTKAVIQLIVAMALAPVFVTLLAVALLLGLLPIPQLRSLILSAQSALIGTVGDSLAFVESPVRAALIRSRILDALEQLKNRCERTVIVAHSQGAAAVLDALGGIAHAPNDSKKPTSAESPPEGPFPDTLVTFGSGVNPLVSLRALSAGLPEEINIGMNPAALAVAAILVMIGSLVFVYANIRFGRTNIPSLVHAAAAFAVGMVGGALLIWGGFWVFDKSAAQNSNKNIKMWTLGSLALVVVAANLIYAIYYDLPMLPVILIACALLYLVASVRMILSPTMREAVTKPVLDLPGLTRWVDLYASADPVPNGHTRMPETMSAEVTSERIWNRGSMLSDHTTYWDNLDGFVLRIARACAKTAESPWQDRLPPETRTAWADLRAEWRVGFLRWTYRINTLFWLFAFVLLWTRHVARVPLPFELPSWSPTWTPPVAQSALLVVLVVVGAWATAALLRWPWILWVRAEQNLVLAQKGPSDKAWAPLIGMGMVITLLALLAWALAHGDESRAGEVLADPGNWIAASIQMLVWGLVLAWIALWLRPAPKRPDT
jgi:hypothetical protein